MTGLISVEGLSTLTARGGTTLLTLGPKVMSTVNDATATSFMKGQAVGNLFAALTGFAV
jgi:hypothetical protein